MPTERQEDGVSGQLECLGHDDGWKSGGGRARERALWDEASNCGEAHFLVRTRTLSWEAVLFSKPQRATDTFQLCPALKAATANGRCRHHHLSAQTFHSTALYSKLFSGSTTPTPSSLASSNSYLRCCQNGRNRGGNANQKNSLDETQIASIIKKTPHHLH